MADSKISALTDGGGFAAGDAVAVARSGASKRVSPIGVPVLVYRYTVAGSDKASIDTGVDTPAAGSNDWTNADLLEVWIVARTDDAAAGANVDITLNNDTTSIYDRQIVEGSGSSALAAAAAAQANWAISVHGSGGSASYPGVIALTIPDFAGTTFWKTAEARAPRPDATGGNEAILAYALGYRSASAITRLKVAAESTAKLKVGSQLLIYKRLAS